MPESVCAGCGAVSDLHPYVGVARDEVTQVMTSYPICYLCWSDPAHRQVSLKMHFFDQRFSNVAVQAAEENILVENPVK
jgi:hypothetical protein